MGNEIFKFIERFVECFVLLKKCQKLFFFRIIVAGPLSFNVGVLHFVEILFLIQNKFILNIKIKLRFLF